MIVKMLILLVALLYAFWNGLHDSPTILAQLVSTRSVGPRLAIFLTGFLEFIGAAFFSRFVLHAMSFGSIRDQLFAIPAAAHQCSTLVLSAIIVALLFNFATWYLGYPSSSTHALFGAITGASFAVGVTGAMILPGVIKFLGILMVSAILGGFLSWGLTRIFYSTHPSYSRGGRAVRGLNVVLGGALALLHGANDMPKSLGLFLLTLGPLAQANSYVYIFALAISFGVLFGENRILRTLGYRLFRMEAIQGLGANICSSTILAAATALGFPVSSTQILVGSVLGAGAAKNARAVRWAIVGEILLSWVITLPVCIALGYIVAKFLG